MAIEVVPHDPKYRAAVEAFNERMRTGGSIWGFYADPVPDWIPLREGGRTWREYHLAIEDDHIVRGGYALKPQEWLINGEEARVTDWQGPFTEAEINPKYSPLMLRLARSAAKQYELLFSLGHSESDAHVLEKMGWGLFGLPFSFRVVRPFRFLRYNRYLRTSATRRLALDALAYTGIGSISLKIATWWLSSTGGHPKPVPPVEVVEEFGDWADTLWQEHKDAYTCLAVRDREVMNALLPKEGWPGGTRLKVVVDGQIIGWSVVFVKQMVEDSRFGSLNVGLIGDCFADPTRAHEVMASTHDYLVSTGVDLVCSNLSHPGWVGALRAIGYVVLPNRRLFAFSPAFKKKIAPIDEIAHGMHLTNLDGHGPHGFTTYDP